jgi:hypothetical protein
MHTLIIYGQPKKLHHALVAFRQIEYVLHGIHAIRNTCYTEHMLYRIHVIRIGRPNTRFTARCDLQLSPRSFKYHREGAPASLSADLEPFFSAR